MDLISVHVPKTAGVTFRSLLQSVYGSKSVHLDYGDRPLDPQSLFQTDFTAWREQTRDAGADLPESVRVIHGHFCAAKYASRFPAAKRIMWLREPVSRLVSHYHYWKSLPQTGHSLHRLLLEKQLTLLEFARLESMRNIVGNVFLKGARLDDFAFVGIQEDFENELQILARWLGWQQALPRTRENSNTSEGYSELAVSEGEREEIACLNALDVSLYQQAQALRAGRSFEARARQMSKGGRKKLCHPEALSS